LGLGLIGLLGLFIRRGKRFLLAHRGSQTGKIVPNILRQLRRIRLCIKPGRNLSSSPLDEFMPWFQLAGAHNGGRRVWHPPPTSIAIGNHAPGQTVIGLQALEGLRLMVGQFRRSQFHHPDDIGLVQFGAFPAQGGGIGVCRHHRRRIGRLLNGLNGGRHVWWTGRFSRPPQRQIQPPEGQTKANGKEKSNAHDDARVANLTCST
jgi:hypothetical protein